MDRNLLGSFVGELLGLSLLGALGFVYGGRQPWSRKKRTADGDCWNRSHTKI
jgi:hypothetical protein